MGVGQQITTARKAGGGGSGTLANVSLRESDQRDETEWLSTHLLRAF